jgi:hypothetical protein
MCTVAINGVRSLLSIFSSMRLAMMQISTGVDNQLASFETELTKRNEVYRTQCHQVERRLRLMGNASIRSIHMSEREKGRAFTFLLSRHEVARSRLGPLSTFPWWLDRAALRHEESGMSWGWELSTNYDISRLRNGWPLAGKARDSSDDGSSLTHHGQS